MILNLMKKLINYIFMALSGVKKFIISISMKIHDNKKIILKTAEQLSKISTTFLLSIFLFGIWFTDESNIITPLAFVFLKNVQIILTFLILVWIINIWSKRDEFSKLNRSIILSSLVTIILSVPVVLLILHIGRLYGSDSGLKIGSSDGWLAFFGSIIGGLITMFSLFFSIRHLNLQNKETFNQKIMPILVCENINLESQDTLWKLLDIKLTNTSENTLFNLSLKSIDLFGYKNSEDKKYQRHIFNSSTSDNNFTLRNNSIKPKCSLDLGKVNIIEPSMIIRDSLIGYLDVFYTFGYTDVYSKKEYTVKLKIEIITQLPKNCIQYTTSTDETFFLKEYIMTSQKIQLLSN